MTIWMIDAFLAGVLVGALAGLLVARRIRKAADERMELVTELWVGLADLQQGVIESYAKTSRDTLRKSKELSAAVSAKRDAA